MMSMKLSSAKDFNSHAHVERDISIADHASVSVNFNSHAHVERDFLIITDG